MKHNHPFTKYNTNSNSPSCNRQVQWFRKTITLPKGHRKYKAWCPFRNYPVQSKHVVKAKKTHHLLTE